MSSGDPLDLGFYILQEKMRIIRLLCLVYKGEYTGDYSTKIILSSVLVERGIQIAEDSAHPGFELFRIGRSNRECLITLGCF